MALRHLAGPSGFKLLVNNQNNMHIEWNMVTWYSKLCAIVFFFAIFSAWTFYLGMQYQEVLMLRAMAGGDPSELPLQEQITRALEAQEQVFRRYPNSQVATYRSENLGLSFQYVSFFEEYNQRVAIQEESNRIYAVTDQQPRNIAYMTVFTKQSTETFDQAVARIAFGGALPSVCKLSPYENYRGPTNYQTRIIQSINEVGVDTADQDPCASSHFAGLFHYAYFIYNPAVPTKIVFVDGGHDPLPSQPRKDSNDTTNYLHADETLVIFK
jgi:hypothetical protein